MVVEAALTKAVRVAVAAVPASKAVRAAVVVRVAKVVRGKERIQVLP
ncbi:MAG: hypothetical protein U9Q90_02635 [Campylobacterota bacterium]|nr:hypothetical protein [Campylobacterota bacterium]